MNRLFVAFFVCLLTGCSMTTTEGLKTGQDSATLQITSERFKGVEVQVDDAPTFRISDLTGKSGGSVEWNVTPGRHIITVWRDGAMQLRRQIFLGNGLGREFVIP